MRSEWEMLALITETAKADPRIRAAYLEGSRANPKAPRDLFQDYDVAYIVKETKPFQEDQGWIDRFGERLYLQYPEEGLADADKSSCYGWLIQFADGNRLDLHVRTAENALANLELYRTLVDKDGIMPKEADISDQRYWVKAPSQKEFSCCCNEFWWCLNNVAKGLWRGEQPYVMEVLDTAIRPELRRMLEWKAGMDHHFSVNTGKAGKYLKQYLPEDVYRRYLDTYCRADPEEIWEAVFRMCVLMDQIAREVAERLNLLYNMKEAAASAGYLERIRKLPPDAVEI